MARPEALLVEHGDGLARAALHTSYRRVMELEEKAASFAKTFRP